MNNLNRLDLNLLKTFDVLMDERSVSRAALRLSITQPAVSGMLNRLRDGFGDPLFIRAQHGMVPTERALQLSQPVKRILRELDNLVQPQEFLPEEADFTIALAGTDYSLSTIIVPLIEKLSILAPNIKVAAEFIRDELVYTRMERGDLDIAFMTPETAPEGLHGRSLFSERYVCVLSETHPLASYDALSVEQFCSADHAIVSYQGGAFSGATDSILDESGYRRRVTVSVPSFLVLVELLKRSRLLAVVPERLLADVSGIKAVELPFVVPGFTKYMVWHERTHANPAQQWVRNLITESFQL
ncbi:LysR family transcriptional regulator [Shewanella sp. AS16]|uniref:LysR family transcriptional regulator n=1 Tax=Shewanella sp. AS16 TaxID=2907625 RepID=UPI001F429BB6|nr:LysR family transcriptional regulator [Shewanella sp. AS16]MCE9687618.1 LysR family transcriptional regulator [Shewanella sp. AS16]